jgi:hypothetical protein
MTTTEASRSASVIDSPMRTSLPIVPQCVLLFCHFSKSGFGVPGKLGSVVFREFFSHGLSL